MKNLIIFLGAVLTLNCNAQWQQTNFPNSTDAWSIVINNSDIFVGGYNGMYLSSNNGNNWIAVNNGFTHVYSIAISGSNIFAGTEHGVYLSSNNGNSWTSVNIGLIDTIIHSLAINGNDIYAGTWGGGIYLSSNNGNNWTPVNVGLTNNNIRTIAINGNNIFVGTNNGIYLSINNGANWTAVNTGLTSPDVYVLAISGSNIFAGTYGGVFLSSNNGGNWTATSFTSSIVWSLAISGTSNIFAGTGNGIFLSSNNGGSWTDVSTGLSNFGVYSLAVNDSYLFAGSDSSKVWRRALSEMVGINEINNNDNNVSVYPNPAKNNITIENTQKFKIEISNIQGQLIKTSDAISNKTNLNVSELPCGIYYIKVKTENGLAIRKFVKE
jgi:hypothetical protein